MFLHGFMGSSLDFQPLLVEISKQFYCIAVDLPGHGNTGSDRYDLPSTAEDLIRLIQAMGIQQPLGLVGYSLGGRIALHLALLYPHYWTKVVIESASAGLATTQARQERQQRDRAIARKLRQPNLDFAEFIDHWYNQPVFTGLNNHPQYPRLVERRLQNNPLALSRSLEHAGLGSQKYLGDLLAINQIPLLLIVGAQDQKFVAINQIMASQCSAAELIVVPDCSHNIHWQQPDWWCQKVLNWFS